MKFKTFLATTGVFFLFQILINIAWGQLLRSQSVDLGRFLGIFVFSLPFSVLGAVVLAKTRFGATHIGFLSLAFGVLDEFLALAGGEGSGGMTGLLSLQLTRPILFSIFSTITYWFAGWSIPTYAINFHLDKLNRELQSTSDTKPWQQQWLVWAGILSGLALAVISYLDHFS